jgi:BirA family biotin operon repressor/biotin-[acetyl-CoA-carboxylase] ligase
MDHNRFSLACLRQGLRPFRLHYFPTLRSTSDHAASLRRRGKLFAPAIILTSRQTAGRGRGRNTWWSQEGCLTVTFVLAAEEHLPHHQLPLAAGLAVRNTVARLCPDSRVQIKWPNDIVCDGRKLAGLLCERIDRLDLIGLGLNVNIHPDQFPKSLRNRITSMSRLHGCVFNITDVLSGLAQSLHQMLHSRKQRLPAALLKEYDEHNALLGKNLVVHQPGSGPAVQGTCQGLDHLGRLLIKADNRLCPIITGQVEVLS